MVCGVQAPPGWDDLPFDLLAKIASGRDDLKAMRMVCTSWRAGFDESVTHAELAASEDAWGGPLTHSLPLARGAFPRVVRVVIDGYQLSDDDLFSLQGSPTIQSLQLPYCSGLKRAALSSLQGLPFLQNLDLLDTDIGQSALQALGRLANISSLSLSMCSGVTWKGIGELDSLPLTRLCLDSCDYLLNIGIGGLQGMSLLTDLSLKNCENFMERHIYGFLGVPLVKLDLTGLRQGEAGLSALGNLTTLRDLVLCGCCPSGSSAEFYYCPKGFTALGNLSLTRLILGHQETTWGSDVGDSCLRELAGMQLMDLDLGFCHRIIDAGLGELRNMPLTKLNLSKCRRITGESLSLALRGLPLAILDLSDCGGITTEVLGVLFLAGLPLTDLNLNGCIEAVTDFSILPLNALCLKRLSIAQCRRVTDLSVDLFLAMPFLAEVCVSGCGLTDEGAQKLRRKIELVNP